MGICAGAYYGCQRVEFEPGHPKLQVLGDRELRFFAGVARGAVVPGFDYMSEAGSGALELHVLPLSVSASAAGSAASAAGQRGEAATAVPAALEPSDLLLELLAPPPGASCRRRTWLWASRGSRPAVGRRRRARRSSSRAA